MSSATTKDGLSDDTLHNTVPSFTLLKIKYKIVIKTVKFGWSQSLTGLRNQVSCTVFSDVVSSSLVYWHTFAVCPFYDILVAEIALISGVCPDSYLATTGATLLQGGYLMGVQVTSFLHFLSMKLACLLLSSFYSLRHFVGLA